MGCLASNTAKNEEIVAPEKVKGGPDQTTNPHEEIKGDQINTDKERVLTNNENNEKPVLHYFNI